MTIASYQVQVESIIAVREKSRKQLRIQSSLEVAAQRGFVDWVDVDTVKMSGIFKRVPERIDLSADINESLVVELYSK